METSLTCKDGQNILKHLYDELRESKVVVAARAKQVQKIALCKRVPGSTEVVRDLRTGAVSCLGKNKTKQKKTIRFINRKASGEMERIHRTEISHRQSLPAELSGEDVYLLG